MIKKLIYILLFVTSYAFSQDVFYVKPEGNDSNNGSDTTNANAWKTWQKAFDTATPADTVYFMGGIYMSVNGNFISPEGEHGYSGKTDSIITYAGYPSDIARGEWPILDCTYHCDSIDLGYEGDIYNVAIIIQLAEHIYFKDIEVRNVFQCDSVLSGAIKTTDCRNLTFERVVVHDIGQRAFDISGGAWKSFYDEGGTEVEPYWPDSEDTTKFINCDVYNLCDSITASPNWDPGNGADGWKTGHYKGNYVLFEGCRGWDYTDDMIDPSTINGAYVRINNCWAMAGPRYFHWEDLYGVERNGIKLSSGAQKIDTFSNGSITNSLALFCDRGFEHLEHYGTRGDFIFYNNTAYKNIIGFAGDGMARDTFPRTAIFRNNLVYGSIDKTAIGTPYEVALSSDGDIPYPESHNIWDYSGAGYPWWVITDTVTVTDDDFVTTDSLTLIALFTASRQADGSLPVNRPLTLAEGSDLIDAGTIIPLSDSSDFVKLYSGIAPDIGATEYQALAPVVSITVTAADDETTIEIDNETLQMSAEVLPDTSKQTVTWFTHSGTGSGTINQSGVVQAVSNGTDTIRATAQDGTGIYDDYILTYSNQNEITVPTVITSATLGNSTYYITSGGNVMVNGGASVTQKGVCWNATGNPTLSDNYTIDGTGTGSYTTSLTFGTPGITYYIRAYAINSEGIALGDERQANPLFTTNPIKIGVSGFPQFKNGKPIFK